MGTANLTVRVLDSSSREALTDFRIAIAEAGKNAMGWVSSAGSDAIEKDLRVGDQVIPIEVRLVRPAAGKHKKTLFLGPGDRRTVEFELDATHVSGQVVDSQDNPIFGALVYFGTEIRGRGDEPFASFDKRRVSGTLTETDGSFDLVGSGDLITVWHDKFSPVTAKVHEARQIVMQDRGSIQGRCLAPNGSGMGNIEVILDQTRSTTTDEEGFFRFESVDAGVRGLIFPNTKWVGWVAVHVFPGEAADVRLGSTIPKVEIGLWSGNQRRLDKLHGVIVGIGDIATVQEVTATNGSFMADQVLPGQYILLSGDGSVASLRIDSAYARAEFGTGDLTIRAPVGARVYIVPKGAGEFVSLIGARMCSQSIPSSGEVRIGPVATGSYGVGIRNRGVVLDVEVMGSGTEVSVRN